MIGDSVSFRGTETRKKEASFSFGSVFVIGQPETNVYFSSHLNLPVNLFHKTVLKPV